MTEMHKHYSDKRSYPAEKARQGRIVLTTPERRAIFIGGLIGMVVLILFTSLLLGT